MIVTDVESAYYFYLRQVCENNSDIGLVKLYEPLILQDIELLLSNKLHIVEGLLREYDLLHH